MSEETTPETNEEVTSQETQQEEQEATPRRMKAKVGRIDGALVEVEVREGDRVKELLERANISFSKGMAITDDDGEEVDVMDNAIEGNVYWVSGNFENGIY